MLMPFSELRERLLQAGVAPRHVRRYLAELADHLADITAEIQSDAHSAGRSPAQTQAAAFARLGTVDTLAAAVLAQPRLRSWSVRVPWAIFGVGPLIALAVAWSIALFILWSGWQSFLPGQASPFQKVDGLASVYFGIGRAIYFWAPVLTGWAIACLAVRQRLISLWPLAGLVLVALAGAALQVHTTRPIAPRGAGGVAMDLAVHASAHSISGALAHAATILSISMVPYLFGRLRNRRHRSA